MPIDRAWSEPRSLRSLSTSPVLRPSPEMKAVNLLPPDLRGTPKKAAGKPAAEARRRRRVCRARRPRDGGRRLRGLRPCGQRGQGPRGQARGGHAGSAERHRPRRRAEAVRGLPDARRAARHDGAVAGRRAVRLAQGARRPLPRAAEAGRAERGLGQRPPGRDQRRHRQPAPRGARLAGDLAHGLRRQPDGRRPRDVASAQHRRSDPRRAVELGQGRAAAAASTRRRPRGRRQRAYCGKGSPPTFDLVVFFENATARVGSRTGPPGHRPPPPPRAPPTTAAEAGVAAATTPPSAEAATGAAPAAGTTAPTTTPTTTPTTGGGTK